MESKPKQKIVIDPAKCTLSGACIKVCPVKAIFVKDGKAAVDHDKCDLDGICIPVCPNRAISFIEE